MSKTLNIFNAGKREFYIGTEDGKDVILAPNKNMDLDQKHAEKLMKMYPREIIPAGSVVSKDGGMKVKELTAENEALKAEMEAKTAELTAANEKIKELETELEAATKPAKK